jgi:hypothetical protein
MNSSPELPMGVPPTHAGSRAFRGACLGVGLGLAATFLWLASAEWFFAEDFLFLKMAQDPRGWWEVFLPLQGRAWWSYRPLTIEVYFSALFAVAGYESLAYLATSIAVHFASAFLVYRLATDLEVDRRVALVVSLLSVAMYPSLNGELFWAHRLPRRSPSSQTIWTI